MRMMDRGETVVVAGADLIAGQPDCGSAIVQSLQGAYAVTESLATTYGLTLTPALLTSAMGRVWLQPGMYFCFAGAGTIDSKCGIAITLLGYRGLSSIGGPVESFGRLKYIDGCTDSLLIAPPLLGDPCFNLLHFPPNTQQTMHTHPSLRCGITVAGRGVASFPAGSVPLEPGACWFLQTGGQHRFFTEKEELLVTAWHPDSDFGPTHDNHPMLNKTMVGEISAAKIPEIRTQ